MFDLSEFTRIAPEWAARLSYYAELGSTNDEALHLAQQGAAHGSVILTDHQLLGRGRRGTQWLSEPGDGLLFSLILRPDYSRQYWSRLALVCGLGIASTLRAYWHLCAEVKWPNDVFINGKKCCGILVEAREDFAIVGIGLNVSYSPSDDISTSVWEELGKPVAREAILADLLTNIFAEIITCGGDEFTSQISQLRKLCGLTGKKIEFISSNKNHTGAVVGIGDQGELLVEQCGTIIPFLQAEQIRVIS